MRFKIDENLPTEVAQLLTVAGHNVLTIHDQQMVGNVDSLVSSVCQSEQRALITLDLDFADIRAYPPEEHHGIVVLRPRTQAKPAVLSLITTFIRLLSTEPLIGSLWILQENGLRIREGERG
jgi:predicted nuclease of predicted toxin-antitoxin system